jgi:hypothetical protein
MLVMKMAAEMVSLVILAAVWYKILNVIFSIWEDREDLVV